MPVGLGILGNASPPSPTFTPPLLGRLPSAVYAPEAHLASASASSGRTEHLADATRAGPALGILGEAGKDHLASVIEHFSSQYGTEVSVTVDIEARRGDGFDVKVVRTVKENAATLKFRTADFEDE